MWHRDTKWEHTVGKMAPTDLPYALLPQSFTLWETQYLWRTTKCGMLGLMWYCHIMNDKYLIIYSSHLLNNHENDDGDDGDEDIHITQETISSNILLW